MNRKVLFVGLLVILPFIVFLASGLRHDPHDIASPLVGKPAPVFTLTDLDGNTVSLEALRGKPVVVNFWATWCVPCIAEHPVFQAASRRYGERVAFLGVIYQDDPEGIRQLLKRRGAWGAALVDPDSQVSIAYGVYGVPETFLIDPQGQVREKITGPVDPNTFFTKLEGLL